MKTVASVWGMCHIQTVAEFFKYNSRRGRCVMSELLQTYARCVILKLLQKRHCIINKYYTMPIC